MSGKSTGFAGLLNRTKAAIQQAKTRVTEAQLINCGFTQEGIKFSMGDLMIRKVADNFYYRNKHYKLIKIKNMFTVSQLVYGRLDYGW